MVRRAGLVTVENRKMTPCSSSRSLVLFCVRVTGSDNVHYTVLFFMFVVLYILVIYVFNSGSTRCTLYSLFLSSLALHVSGVICTHHQEHNCHVQPEAVYLWKTEVLVSSGVDVCFVWICVYSFFKAKHTT
jgi:hypothetical protein